MRMLRLTGFFLLAGLTAEILGAIFHTQFVLSALIAVGAEVSFGTRVCTTAQDILGLAPVYGMLIFAGLGIGFVVAALVIRRVPRLRFLGYILAGGVSMLCVVILLHTVLEISALAGARTVGGLLFQGVAGGGGGYVFALLTSKFQRASH